MVPPNEPIGDDDSQDTPDWLAEGDLDSDDAMAWLEEIAAKYDPDFEKSTEAADEAEETAPEEEAEPVAPSLTADDALPDWLAEEEPITESTVQEGEADLPDWLKEEEPVTSPVAAAPADEEEDEGDLPDWLKAEEPAPPPAAESVEDELAWLREPVESPEPIVSDDSDELPDWLKDEEPVSQVAAASTTGEDTEDALAWLNQHVTEQGVSPDEIVSESLTVDTPPTTPVAATPAPDAEAEAVSDDELPDWLKEAGGPQAMAEALAGEPSDFDLEDIPELEADEEDLAWLADTLDAESEKADDELAALFGELAEEEEEVPEPVVEAEPALEAEEAVEEEEEEEAPAPVMAEEPEAELVAAVEEEDLPDWLTEEEPKPSPGLTDWLRSPEAEAEEEEKAPEPAAEAEPAAEVEPALEAEEAVEEEEEEEAPAPVMAEEPEAEPAAEAAPAPSPVPAAPAQPVEIPAALQGDFMGQLNTAREKMKARALDEALVLYENLVSHRQMLEQTISDMEYAAQSAEKPDPRIRRTLGDALRASGRLQEALEAYRAALDEL